MLHFKKVCPFERIFSLYLGMGKLAKAAYIELFFDGYPSVRAELSKIGEGSATALGYSENDRLSFMDKPEVTGRIRFLSATKKVMYDKAILVINDLVTDGPVVDDIVNAEDSQDNVFGYPEVYDSITPVKLGAFDEKAPRAPMLRPALVWVISERNSEMDIIHGPLATTADVVQFGIATMHAGQQLSVFSCHQLDTAGFVSHVFKSVVEVPTSALVKPEVDESVTAALSIVTVDVTSGSQAPWFIGQSCMMFNGKALTPMTTLQIIKLGLFFELMNSGRIPLLNDGLFNSFYSKEKNTLYVPLRLYNTYVLDSGISDFYYTYVDSNDVVASYMKNFGYADDGVYLSAGGVSGKLAGVGSQSCFFFAFAMAVAARVDKLSLATVISVMGQLASSPFFRVRNGVFEGVGQIDTKLPIQIRNANGVFSSVISRRTTPKPPAKDGFYIVGFDRANGKKDGVCDHYVYAQRKNGSDRVIYDPYRSEPLPFGAQLAPLISEDSVWVEILSDPVETKSEDTDGRVTE